MRRPTRADLIFGILLSVTAVAICIASAGMIRRFTNRLTPYYYTPGFLPLILGATLLGLGITLVIQHRHALRLSWRPSLRPKDVFGSRVLWAVVLITAYVFTLSRLHFLPATASFLVISMLVFYKRTLLVPVVVAGAAVGGVYFVFVRIFFIPLP